jgi:hypothetical protein
MQWQRAGFAELSYADREHAVADVEIASMVTAQVRRNDSGFSRCEGSIFLDAGLAFRFKDS